MKYHFDKPIKRRGTYCDKWDAPFVEENVIPMWVADMDFKIAPAISKRLIKVAQRGVFGYQFLSDDYYDAIIQFLKKRHRYQVKKEWICYVPNVVLSLFLSIQAVSEIGDEVIIQTPVYGPFYKVVLESERCLVENPLINNAGYYTMDYYDLEKKITDKTKALLLCNPHNPAGRVWNKKELEKLVEICVKHDICIISDDIHSDIISEEHEHTMIASVCEQYQCKCITAISPSKPFNLASIHVANCIIENDEIRKKFQKLLAIYHVNECNAFAEEALIGAYMESDEWLEEMNRYVEGNINYFVDYIHQNLPILNVHKPEGTYLVWVDFRKTKINPENVKDYLNRNCHVLVDEGEFFGEKGKGYVRFNLACPRTYIETVLENIKKEFGKVDD